MIDRKIFFDYVRKHLGGGSLKDYQVDGFTRILDEFEATPKRDIRMCAYICATSWHETATRMQPVIETRQASEATNPSVETAIARLEHSWAAGRMPWVKAPYWRKDANGMSWLGRGYPQCTFKANYAKCEQMTGVAFTTNPDLMLTPGPAIKAMFSMMFSGGYTGHKLLDYFNAKNDDPFNARRVINGVESAGKVNGYHVIILAGLKAAGG